MADGHDDLEDVAGSNVLPRIALDNVVRRRERERSPDVLTSLVRWMLRRAELGLTTVRVSMQSMKGSEVMYRESDWAYSRQSDANSSSEDPIWAWFLIKYPSNSQCRKAPGKGGVCQLSACVGVQSKQSLACIGGSDSEHCRQRNQPYQDRNPQRINQQRMSLSEKPSAGFLYRATSRAKMM